MKIEMGWAYGTHGRKEWCIQGLVERPEGKRQLGRPCHKGNDNIKMSLIEVRLGGMDWIDLAEDGCL
jgi:cytochrome bd-type quinol oxidase subunit 1